jgi:hypothetical protein
MGYFVAQIQVGTKQQVELSFPVILVQKVRTHPYQQLSFLEIFLILVTLSPFLVRIHLYDLYQQLHPGSEDTLPYLP